MSTRTNLRPQVVINAASMAANITSAPTILQSLSTLSYSISWTGTSPVGTISLQASNDYALNPNGTVANSGTWETLTVASGGSPVTTLSVSGNTGTGFIDITPTGAYSMRIIYTAASGSGTMTAIVNGKVS